MFKYANLFYIVFLLCKQLQNIIMVTFTVLCSTQNTITKKEKIRSIVDTCKACFNKLNKATLLVDQFKHC